MAAVIQQARKAKRDNEMATFDERMEASRCRHLVKDGAPTCRKGERLKAQLEARDRAWPPRIRRSRWRPAIGSVRRKHGSPSSG
jgi:hypothetical protein